LCAGYGKERQTRRIEGQDEITQPLLALRTGRRQKYHEPGDDGDSDSTYFDPADARENPEQSLLRLESEREAAGSVDKFLTGLQANVRGKIKQYNRMLGVLWHCYLSPDHATQLEVAATLGVSDSLVSDYRRRIEQELRALSFKEVEEARMFELALRERVRGLAPLSEDDGLVT